MDYYRCCSLWLALIGCSIGGTLGAGAPADAATDSATACLARALTTVDMAACERAERSAADARVATAYARALHALPSDQRAQLVLAQRRWQAFRDSDCRVFVGTQTGSLAPLEAERCLIERARVRECELAAFAAPESAADADASTARRCERVKVR